MRDYIDVVVIVEFVAVGCVDCSCLVVAVVVNRMSRSLVIRF